MDNVLGVLCMTDEYGSGMIRSSLAAVPSRPRLLAAKAAVLALVTLVGGEAVTDVNPRNRTSSGPGDENPVDRTGGMRISELGTSRDFQGLLHHAVFAD